MNDFQTDTSARVEYRRTLKTLLESFDQANDSERTLLLYEHLNSLEAYVDERAHIVAAALLLKTST